MEKQRIEKQVRGIENEKKEKEEELRKMK